MPILNCHDAAICLISALKDQRPTDQILATFLKMSENISRFSFWV